MRERIEGQTALGALSAFFGVMFYADAIGTGRVYGYTTGSVAEFVIGTVMVVTGAVLLYLAGMNRRRMALAASDRRGRWVRGLGCARTSVR